MPRPGSSIPSVISRSETCGRFGSARETFQQNRTTATPANRKQPGDGIEVVFVENVYDPDPDDGQYETTVLYLIREHGRLRVETDHWTMGLFTLDTWRRVLREARFDVHEQRYRAGGDEYTMFACVRL